MRSRRPALRDHRQHFDPDTEVLVTVGATEAIAAAVLGLCEPGDEVLMLEPHYDSYAAVVAMAGARHRSVPLRPDATGRFALDVDELAPRSARDTRLLILNSPHNPTGTVLTDAELAGIAAARDRARPDRDHRRGVRVPDLRRRSRTCRSARSTAWPSAR